MAPEQENPRFLKEIGFSLETAEPAPPRGIRLSFLMSLKGLEELMQEKMPDLVSVVAGRELQSLCALPLGAPGSGCPEHFWV